MKAAAAGLPGIVQYIDFPEPETGEDGVVLAALACGLCATDLKTIQKGSAKPEYALGHELVGRVIAAGPQSGWQTGQLAAAAPYLPCGACSYCLHDQPTLCPHLFETSLFPGGMAERVFIPGRLAKHGLFLIPEAMPVEHAALAEPLGCVIKGLQDARFQPGDAVLVIGDGPMGVMAAAAARAMGAGSVLLAGLSPHRLKIARTHYADETLPAGEGSLRERVKALTSGRGADIVIAAVSNPAVLTESINCVRPGGVVNAFAGVPDGSSITLDVRKLHYEQYYLTGSFGTAPGHMKKALELMQSKALDPAGIVTACFPFDRISEAVEYARLQTGLKAVIVF
jgi:L-iditol 2-dehydrogenase